MMKKINRAKINKSKTRQEHVNKRSCEISNCQIFHTCDRIHKKDETGSVKCTAYIKLGTF